MISIPAFFDELVKIGKRRAALPKGKKIKTGDAMSSSVSGERDGAVEDASPDPEKGYGFYGSSTGVPGGRHVGFK